MAKNKEEINFGFRCSIEDADRFRLAALKAKTKVQRLLREGLEIRIAQLEGGGHLTEKGLANASPPVQNREHVPTPPSELQKLVQAVETLDDPRKTEATKAFLEVMLDSPPRSAGVAKAETNRRVDRVPARGIQKRGSGAQKSRVSNTRSTEQAGGR